MPALRVSVDGQQLATVAFGDENNMVAFSVHGDRSADPFAMLDMHGGHYSGDGESRHLIWIDDRALQAGQVVAVEIVADTLASSVGKTISELYPDETPCEKTDFTPTAAVLEEWRARPKLRSGYRFRLTNQRGIESTGSTEGDEYGFTFRVVWTALDRPERARYSVTSTTVEQVHKRAPSREHAVGELRLGECLRFEVLENASA